VFEYDDFSRSIILKFKHGDATYMRRSLSMWMYRAAKDIVSDLIVSTPIHFFKRLKRKYNQTELLAQELGRLFAIHYEPRVLTKEKPTIPQEGLTRYSRLTNVKGSFGVDSRYAPLLSGKVVMLVDDVMTTGATADECAKILKKHGAEKVIILTAARVSFAKIL
jgi:ComF family protein